MNCTGNHKGATTPDARVGSGQRGGGNCMTDGAGERAPTEEDDARAVVAR